VWGQLKQGRDVVWQDRTLLARDYLLPAQAARKIVVGGDNDQPHLLQQACIGAQVLIHEATYTEDVAAKVGPSVMHSDAARVARFAQQSSVPNLILTHFSPRYQHNPAHSPSIEDIRQEALQHYDGQLWLAEDLARYRLNKGGQLQRMEKTAGISGSKSESQ
jgi:ribonuclease Z